MSIINFDSVSFSYMPGTPFERVAVQDLSFQIEHGEKVGIFGGTGCGKSTILQLMTGLIKPDRGEVRYCDKDIREVSVLRELRREVGFVFQFPENQLFGETVEEDIAFGPMNQGWSNEEVDAAVSISMNDLGLKREVIGKRDPFTLSGGEKRRVAIAGVLAMKPKVLIFDEPTAGLDHKGKTLLAKKITELSEKERNTVVIVSHDLEELIVLCDRLMVIKNGSLLLESKCTDISAVMPELYNAGAEVPFYVSVSEALKARDPNAYADVRASQIEEMLLKKAGLQ